MKYVRCEIYFTFKYRHPDNPDVYVDEALIFENRRVSDSTIMNALWTFETFIRTSPINPIDIESIIYVRGRTEDVPASGNWICTRGVKLCSELHCAKSLNLWLNSYNKKYITKQSKNYAL